MASTQVVVLGSPVSDHSFIIGMREITKVMLEVMTLIKSCLSSDRSSYVVELSDGRLIFKWPVTYLESLRVNLPATNALQH